MSTARSGTANLDPKVLAALMYESIRERVMARDVPHLTDLSYRTGLLTGMDQPWERRTPEDRRMWVQAAPRP